MLSWRANRDPFLATEMENFVEEALPAGDNNPPTNP